MVVKEGDGSEGGRDDGGGDDVKSMLGMVVV